MKDAFDDYENVVSATECTGLMAIMPHDLQEDENQARLYSIHAAVKKEKRCRKRRKNRP